MNILEFLKNNTPDNKRTTQFKHIRFSEQAGQDVTLTLQSLSFDRLEEIKRLHGRKSDIYIVLEGVVEPNLKDGKLRDKYQVTGYDQLIEKIFLAGEIENISSQILILSGFGSDSVKELEKNSQSVQD